MSCDSWQRSSPPNNVRKGEPGERTVGRAPNVRLAPSFGRGQLSAQSSVGGSSGGAGSGVGSPGIGSPGIGVSILVTSRHASRYALHRTLCRISWYREPMHGSRLGRAGQAGERRGKYSPAVRVPP
jgi:hypothetical protein